MTPVDRPFEEMAVGDTATFTRTFTQEDVEAFAALSGDHNPLHTDVTYAAQTPFMRPVVYGMLVASLSSTLVGMHLPGVRCLYLAESFSFKKPVYPGEELTVSGVVRAKSEATRILDIGITITRGSDTVAEGSAQVQVRPL